MLIDKQYFTSGRRLIENASSAKLPSASAQSVNAVIEGFIKDLQPKYLKELLGKDAAKTIEDDLVSGTKKYTALEEMMKEPFADYVFFHILRNGASNSVTGSYRLKTANIPISPIDSQVQVWNSMVEGNMEIMELLMSDSQGLDVVVSDNLLKPINQFNL